MANDKYHNMTEITDLQRAEIDVQNQMLRAMRSWKRTCIYIAFILTIMLILRLTGHS